MSNSLLPPSTTSSVAPAMAPAMALALQGNFGSTQEWQAEFAAMATAHSDSAGRVALVFKSLQGTLVNGWLAGSSPMSSGDEALLEFKLTPGAGVDDFIAHIDWAAVYERYQHAVHAAGEAWGTTPDAIDGSVIIDVRRAGVFDAAPTMLPGAHWRDPAHVGRWATELPAGQAVTVYCVYGHEVGRVTALRLRAAGLNARYLQGGIHDWQAAGLPTQGKATGGSSA